MGNHQNHRSQGSPSPHSSSIQQDLNYLNNQNGQNENNNSDATSKQSNQTIKFTQSQFEQLYSQVYEQNLYLRQQNQQLVQQYKEIIQKLQQNQSTQQQSQQQEQPQVPLDNQNINQSTHPNLSQPLGVQPLNSTDSKNFGQFWHSNSSCQGTQNTNTFENWRSSWRCSESDKKGHHSLTFILLTGVTMWISFKMVRRCFFRRHCTGSNYYSGYHKGWGNWGQGEWKWVPKDQTKN